MDVTRPIPNQEITAAWGAAVSDALRAQGLTGPGVVRAPGGTSLPPKPSAAPARIDPPAERFAAWIAWDTADEGYRVRVRKGAVRDAAGNGLTLSATDLTDKGDWWEGEATGGEIAAEDDGDGGWKLVIGEPSGSPAWRIPLASVSAEPGGRPVIAQYRAGDQTAGGHFGDAEGAAERAAWTQSEEVPAVLSLDGETAVKVLVDSRGNIMSWTSAESGESPETPTNPYEPAPVCGNPLNASGGGAGRNPLDGQGGSAESRNSDDYNPLDYEGDGGYTPKCGA